MLLLLAGAAPLRAGAEEPPPAPPAEAAAPPAAEVRRVLYLPEGLRAQIRDELRREVMEQARLEGWAAPGLVPAWVSRVRLGGDVRTRFERDLFGSANALTGEFPDFNAINGNKPFDVNFVDVANERYLDVDRDRSRPRLRARVWLESSAGGGFSTGLRLVSGDSSSPVSTNQTLGGGFAKLPVWLDRAWLAWRSGERDAGLAVQVGRFENPFFSSEMIWNESLNFDGLAVRAATALGPVQPFLVGGAFPLYTTPLAWPAERSAKLRSHDKWLFAGQAGAGLWSGQPISAKVAAAYYHFQGVEGRASGPCDTYLKDVSCDSDDSRPAFAQRGNTYMVLRTPSPAAQAAEAAGLAARYQYFGLASRFGVLAFTGRLEAALPAGLLVAADGEYAVNLALSRKRVQALALNNLKSCSATGGCSRWDGSATGFTARLTLGSQAPEKQGGWRVAAAYRQVGSDAMVDGFTDSDLGLGGTNLRGTSASVAVALADGVTLGARWLGADALAGPTYQVDVVQLDLAARF
jgi:hypothetical protein